MPGQEARLEIRPFHKDDAAALADLSRYCGRGESDFVLNPYWETEAELFAEFDRFGISPEEHLLVADAGDGEVQGLVGFLRQPGASQAGMCCPIVPRGSRGKGIGGELLRAARRHGGEQLGIQLATAGIGTRNRAGYSLLTSLGFRPVRQHFLMRCDRRPAADAPALEGIELEPARDADADAILAIYAACGFARRTSEEMRRVLVDGRHTHTVARQGDRVIAFCELETHWPQRVWVSYIGVDPKERDRGLGTALVTWTLARQFDDGAETALLLLSPANRTAYRAYEKGGFRRHRLIDVLESPF
jgi:ribosomal protein S18 acetylase RimI-like enzyme